MKRRALCLLSLFVCLALGSVCLRADQANAPSRITRLLDVSVEPDGTGATFVDISTSASTHFHVYRIDHPTRLVLDLDQTRVATSRRTIPGQASVVRDVRIGQFHDPDPTVARVVADVNEDFIFDVQERPGGLRIELRPRHPRMSLVYTAASPLMPLPLAHPLATLARAALALAPPVRPPSATSPESRPPTAIAVRQAAASVASTGSGRDGRRRGAIAYTVASPLAALPPNETLLALLTGPRQPLAAAVPQVGSAAAVPALRASATSSLAPDHRGEGKSTYVASIAQDLPAQTTVAPAGRAAQTLARDAAAEVSRSQGQTEPAAQPSTPLTRGQAPSRSSAQTPSQYTGERISLNLKDVDLKDFFRLVHEISGLNVIVDPNVSGTLTLVLDDVPWDQALDIVLKNNGLGKVLEGNILRIAKIETLTAEQDQAAKFKQAQEDAAPLVTVVRYLKYARAVDTAPTSGGTSGGGFGAVTPISGVVTIIKSMAATLLSKRGNVVADPRNNAVVITDVPSQIPIIEAVIDKLDRRSKQISIEARIVLTTSDFTREFQASLTNFLRNNSGSVFSGGQTGTGSSVTANTPTGTPPLPIPPGATNPIAISPNPAAGFGAYAITNISGRYFISATIAAAETNNKARTLSSPTIVTQNNVPGEVLQGTQIPLQTTINNTVTTIYINATLTLDVLPQVTEDGNIFLNIRVQNNSPGPVLQGTMNPEINTQAATTQVMVPDGGTVIFGGIKVNANTSSVQQVPGLGSIPVLGHLFKSTNRENTQNELLFIVTPKVLPG